MQYKGLLDELESLLEKKGYTVRKEKGSFSGDYCLLEGDKVIMINKSRPVEIQLGVYARILRNEELDNEYLKPATWKYLKTFWQKTSDTD
jgi:hypothetical protein